MAIIGMDIHRAFAEVVALEGKSRRRLGRIAMRCDRLAAFAAGLTKEDIVVVEATGNATAVAEVLAPHVGRVIIANPKQVRVIAHAKIKTDKIDAAVLAELYASGFLPEVWIPDKDTDLAQYGLADLRVKQLMTVPGLDMIVATALVAAIGDVSRFGSPRKLVSYLGLNPSVRQSGSGPAYHGRISKQGPGRARGLLVEAAWAAARAPGPLRAFFLRIRSRRGQHVAAVATARKLAVLVWHVLTKEQGHAPVRGQRGSAYDYNIKGDQERRRVQQAEKVYERFVAGWNRRGPRVRTSAAKEERQ